MTQLSLNLAPPQVVLLGNKLQARRSKHTLTVCVAFALTAATLVVLATLAEGFFA